MRQSTSVTKLLAALGKFHAEIKTIGYDSTNSFFNAKYASLTAIIEVVRPLLTKHGLTVVQGGAEPRLDDRMVLRTLDVVTTLFHESGEWLSVSLTVAVEADPVSKGSDIRMPNPQTVGKAVTYARRYLISLLLCLVTDEDTDGNHPERDPRGGSNTPPKAASKPEPKKAEAKPSRVPSPEAQLKAALGFAFPFKGEFAGKPLEDVALDTLTKALAGCQSTDPEKYAEFIAAASLVVATNTEGV